MNEGDEPNRVTSADIDGLRGDTRNLTTSVDKLAERQKATESRVNDNEAQITENRRLSKRANVNSVVAIGALVLVVIALGIGWNANRAQRDRDAADVKARRIADCLSIGEIADKIVTPAAGEVITNPERAARYKAAVAAGVVDVRAGKGYSADCSQIGPPPGK